MEADIFYYTLDEIIALNNQELYETYFNYLNDLATNRIAREVIQTMQGFSLNRISEKIFQQEEQNRSTMFFSGDLVLLHESIKESRARNFITCDFSGGQIIPGSHYLAYRPIIENISTNNSYVLKKTIKVETGYYADLPRDISELEELQKNLELELDLNDGINYSHLNRQMGGSLTLMPLRRKGKTKIKRRNVYEISNCK